MGESRQEKASLYGKKMPTKVAYLFGAGASQGELSYGDAPKSILMQAIADGIALKMSREPYRRLRVVSNDLVEGINIEDLITLYEMSGTREYSEIAEKLKTLFRNEIEETIGQLGGSFTPALFTALIDMHSISRLGEELVLILTTNYEDLIEKAMQLVKGGINYSIKTICTADYYRIKEDGVPILKLHGSFNWKNSYPIRVQKKIRKEKDIIWIPPGVVKKRQYYPFDVVWGRARELLECDTLRIIGCSLSRNDWELVSLVHTTQKLRTDRKAPYTIELIDFPDQCEEIKKQHGYLKIKTILEIPEVRQFLIRTYLPSYIDAEEVPEERIEGVAKYLDKENIFALWLRAKGEKLYYDRVPIRTRKRYFEKFILRGLGL